MSPNEHNRLTKAILATARIKPYLLRQEGNNVVSREADET
jgi:hypothetical protein